MSRTETQNYDLLCSVKFMVVVRDLLSPEAVFDDRLFFCQRDGVIMLGHGCSSFCKLISHLVSIDTAMGRYPLQHYSSFF